MSEEKYNFDCVVDRHDTCATKFEEMDAKFGRHDLLPFWIADMDFQACPAIIEALRSRLNHTVLGYTTPPDEFWSSITDWLKRRHAWSVNNDEITFMPGLKKGLSLCINYFTRPGDAVLIQPPVYHSFHSVIEGNGRIVANNPLIRDDSGRYVMDFKGLEEVIGRERPAMMILCNPHNPIGLQWDADTLRRVVSICHDNGVVLVSDEIYGDMMLDGRSHIPTASVSPQAEEITITLGAPSKTFNIPGIVSAWCVVKSEKIRTPFFNWLSASEFNAPPIAAMVATQAAYEHGEKWLDQALEYLQANVEHAVDFFNKNLPQIKLYKPEASFTVWLDFNGLGLSREDLVKLIVERGHNLRLSQKELKAGDTLQVSVDVKNTGDMAGKEIVQLYISRIVEGEVPGAHRPFKQLKGFEKVEIQPGETKTVTIQVPLKDVTFWSNFYKKMVIEEGVYQVSVGPDSVNLPCQDTFTVAGKWDAELATVYADQDRTVYTPGQTGLIKVVATLEDTSRLCLSKNKPVFTSSNESVAVVDADGVVTAVAPGTALITAAVTYKGKTVKASRPVAVK